MTTTTEPERPLSEWERVKLTTAVEQNAQLRLWVISEPTDA